MDIQSKRKRDTTVAVAHPFPPCMPYFGAKVALRHALVALLPPNSFLESVYVPFFGSGAFTFELATLDAVRQVHGREIETVVFQVLQEYLKAPERLITMVMDNLKEPMTKSHYDGVFNGLLSELNLQRRASNYIALAVNGFQGRVNKHGWRSRSKGGELLRVFNDWKQKLEVIIEHPPAASWRSKVDIRNADGFEMLECLLAELATSPRKCFLFVDPPYQLKFTNNVYGIFEKQERFDLTRLSCLLQKLHSVGQCKWMVTLNDTPEVRDAFQDCCCCIVKAKSEQLVITNYVVDMGSKKIPYLKENKWYRL